MSKLEDARTFSNALNNLTNKKLVEAIREENEEDQQIEEDQAAEESSESQKDEEERKPDAAE